MDPRSEVLLRQAELFQGSLLLAGLPADDLLGRLPNAFGWCWHAGDQAALDARFEGRSHFGVNVPERAFDSAVVFLPKSKDLTDYILNAVAARLPGREVFLVGKTQRYRRRIQAAQPVWQTAQTRQRAPLPIVASDRGQRAGSQIAGKPGADVRAATGRRPAESHQPAGVFSHGRLDRGSALLLEHLDKLPSGHLLDFGCGAGVLGAAVKRRYPHNQVTLLDVDAFAAASSRLTLAANGLEAEVLTGDGIDAAPMGLNAILSNPPFHVGCIRIISLLRICCEKQPNI